MSILTAELQPISIKSKIPLTEDWNLGISPDEFKHIYGDTVDIEIFLHAPGHSITREQVYERIDRTGKTEFQIQEEYLYHYEQMCNEDLIQNYLPSKLWRLNNLYKIIDKKGKKIDFKMNRAQHKVYAAALEHPRLIILKSRQQGISTFWLIFYFDDAVFIEDLTVGLMAQGNEEAEILLERVKTAWEGLPMWVIDFLSIGTVKNNTSRMSFNNGSTIYVRNSFRSATLQRLHISEYGKICAKNPDRAEETKTGTMQAIAPGNYVVIESTAEGNNDFKAMWDKAIINESLGRGYSGKDFKPVFLSWLDDPDCRSNYIEEELPTHTKYFEELESLIDLTLSADQKNFWIMQYKELDKKVTKTGLNKIFQEYPATPEEAFTKTLQGAFYATSFHEYVRKRKRIVKGLYDPNLEVNVAIDLGISETDVFSMIFFQRWQDEWRIINEYQNYNEGLAHYVNHMNSLGYKIWTVVCPHDIRVKELNTGKSRYDTLVELGVHEMVILEATSVMDGIEAVRQTLPNIWIDEKCEYMIDCFLNYSKEWDEKYNTWKLKAHHDEWSHGADAIRYMIASDLGRAPKMDMRSQIEAISVVDGLAI